MTLTFGYEMYQIFNTIHHLRNGGSARIEVIKFSLKLYTFSSQRLFY